MPGESKSSPRRIKAVERERQALAMRLAGASFVQIAENLGYRDKSGAYRSVMAALARIPAPEVDSYRRLNLERLNQMRLQYWGSLRAGDRKMMELEVKVQEREAKYVGLDAPVRHVLAGDQDQPIVISIAELAKRAKINELPPLSTGPEPNNP